jgi:hypothetical protein
MDSEAVINLEARSRGRKRPNLELIPLCSETLPAFPLARLAFEVPDNTAADEQSGRHNSVYCQTL